MKNCPIMASGLAVLFVASGAGVALAQSNTARTVDQYSCKDVMREHGGNRDVTIAFLHGYLLGKSEARHSIPMPCTSRPAPLSNIVSTIPAKRP